MVFRSWIIILMFGLFACADNLLDTNLESRVVEEACYFRDNDNFQQGVGEDLQVIFHGVTINSKRYDTTVPLVINNNATDNTAPEVIANFLFKNGRKRGLRPDAVRFSSEMNVDTARNLNILTLRFGYKGVPIGQDISYHVSMNAGAIIDFTMREQTTCYDYNKMPRFTNDFEKVK